MHDRDLHLGREGSAQEGALRVRGWVKNYLVKKYSLGRAAGDELMAGTCKTPNGDCKCVDGPLTN